MRQLVHFGMRQAVLMNLVFIAVTLIATLLVLPRLPVDRYPNFSFGEVSITVPYPGASAADVERLVTKRIEDAIRGMDDLEYVKSTSIQGQAEVSIKFIDDTDYPDLFKELRLRVLAAQNQFPVVDGKPLAPRFDEIETDQWVPVVQFDLFSDQGVVTPLAKRELSLLARELQTRLEGLPGVRRISLWGDPLQQYVISLDPERLRTLGITIEQVTSALQNAGLSLPAGRLSTPAGERLIRVDGSFRSPEDIATVVIRQAGDGSTITVGDVSEPSETGIQRFDDATIVTLNGRDSVSCRVAKDREADARTVKAAAMAELERFAKAHAGEGLAYSVTQDSTIAIDDSIEVLQANILQGTVLVLTIQALFLGLRSAAITLSGLAFSVLGTLIWFWATGASLNELSLLGFVIAVGILVDDEVVILDNIKRHRLLGKPIAQAAIDGTVEMFWPLVTGTFTNIAGFLPLFLMSGLVGEFFALVPQAVAVSLLISLLEVVLMVPLHVVDVERLFGAAKPGGWSEGILRPRADGRGAVASAYRGYDRLVDLLLRRPSLAMLATGTLFLLALGVLTLSAFAARLGVKPLLHLEFFPSDAAAVEIRVTLPTGSTVTQTDQVVRNISAYLAARGPNVVRAASGLAGMQIDTTYKPFWGPQYGFIMAELAGRDERSFDDPNRYIVKLSEDIESTFEHDGIRIEIQAQEGGPPTGLPVVVRLGGIDSERIAAAAADLKTWMTSQASTGGTLEGLIDIHDDHERFNTVLSFTPDRRRLAEHSISEAEAQRFVAALHDGVYVGEYRRSDEDVPLRVRLSRAGLITGTALGDVPVRWVAGDRPLRYTDLGTVTVTEEPAQIVRRDFVRTITVSAGLSDASPLNAFTAQAAVREWFDANAQRWPGVVLAFGGEAESTGRSYASLTLAFVVAVLSIYALLAMQFRDGLQPLLILSNIIFSFTGVVLMMGLFGVVVNVLGPDLIRAERSTFTVNSFIAIIALTGMVTNNAIVLIDFINTRRAAGLETGAALRLAGRERLAPIALTTITTLVGFLPTAIGWPDFNPTWAPMATAFIAGLSMSTVLTLLVMPVLYQSLDRHRRAISWTCTIIAGLAIVLLSFLVYG